jgi:hypothetical protein
VVLSEELFALAAAVLVVDQPVHEAPGKVLGFAADGPAPLVVVVLVIRIRFEDGDVRW